ncbi:Protein FAM89A [Takifugu flavidus]|uniref:Protein FAM89A n=1 Tax=Takifugu flavidus TaxID=433684 RepID=A0A5C6NPE2_9TELE|nr:Protein FAM89A [Takifugu flavidus]
MNGKSTNGSPGGMACIEGLPPLPKSLSGLLNSSGGSWREMERMYVKKTMIQDDLSRGRNNADSLLAHKPANLDAALALLRKEMAPNRPLETCSLHVPSLQSTIWCMNFRSKGEGEGGGGEGEIRCRVRLGQSPGQTGPVPVGLGRCPVGLGRSRVRLGRSWVGLGRCPVRLGRSPVGLGRSRSDWAGPGSDWAGPGSDWAGLSYREPVGLRQQDMSLLCQLWSLHESIQEYKGSCQDLSAASSLSMMDNGYFDEDDEYYAEPGANPPGEPEGEVAGLLAQNGSSKEDSWDSFRINI